MDKNNPAECCAVFVFIRLLRSQKDVQDNVSTTPSLRSERFASERFAFRSKKNSNWDECISGKSPVWVGVTFLISTDVLLFCDYSLWNVCGANGEEQ
jgi:hypothetical protein